ncbi:MAG TPA: antibiotic biosynthesis monooxygenase [Beutenbergiaceae bacterium]|nr:antibiotic biosynthesis monooxygenase [Beutenbergiaceae bacterium]
MAVHLDGELVCRDPQEAAVVARHLPRHTDLTRAEAGCVSFEVTATDDPLVWRVQEHFTDGDSFRAHQHRSARSQWGQVTAGIERRYTVTGLDERTRAAGRRIELWPRHP